MKTKPTYGEMRIKAMNLAKTVEGVVGGNANVFYVETANTDGAEDRLRKAAVRISMAYENHGLSAKPGDTIKQGSCPLTGKPVVRLSVHTPPFGAPCYADDKSGAFYIDRSLSRPRRYRVS